MKSQKETKKCSCRAVGRGITAVRLWMQVQGGVEAAAHCHATWGAPRVTVTSTTRQATRRRDHVNHGSPAGVPRRERSSDDTQDMHPRANFRRLFITAGVNVTALPLHSSGGLKAIKRHGKRRDLLLCIEAAQEVNPSGTVSWVR